MNRAILDYLRKITPYTIRQHNKIKELKAGIRLAMGSLDPDTPNYTVEENQELYENLELLLKDDLPKIPEAPPYE